MPRKLLLIYIAGDYGEVKMFVSDGRTGEQIDQAWYDFLTEYDAKGTPWQRGLVNWLIEVEKMKLAQEGVDYEGLYH